MTDRTTFQSTKGDGWREEREVVRVENRFLPLKCFVKPRGSRGFFIQIFRKNLQTLDFLQFLDLYSTNTKYDEDTEEDQKYPSSQLLHSKVTFLKV